MVAQNQFQAARLQTPERILPLPSGTQGIPESLHPTLNYLASGLSAPSFLNSKDMVCSPLELDHTLACLDSVKMSCSE